MENSRSPSQNSMKSRQFLNALMNQSNLVSLEKLQRQDNETSALLNRSKGISSNKSVEKDVKRCSSSRNKTSELNASRNHDEILKAVSENKLFHDITTSNHKESMILEQTKELSKFTATQEMSHFGSKYIKNCYTDMLTDNDLRTKRQGSFGDHDPIPFSMVSSFNHPNRPTINNQESQKPYDKLQIEIKTTKNEFDQIKSENSLLKSQLEEMKQQMQKLSEEKKVIGELHDLKMQQFENRVKLMEMRIKSAETKDSNEKLKNSSYPQMDMLQNLNEHLMDQELDYENVNIMNRDQTSEDTQIKLADIGNHSQHNNGFYKEEYSKIERNQSTMLSNENQFKPIVN